MLLFAFIVVVGTMCYLLGNAIGYVQGTKEYRSDIDDIIKYIEEGK